MSSSPFFSELSKLDDSLRTIQSQVDRVRAGLDCDEGLLKQSVSAARQHVAFLRDLIRAENPEARWNDRDALEHLILALEIAADEKRKERRRVRLLELASELESGRAKHRVSARAAAMNALRLKAVEQLKADAAGVEQEKELPGPEAAEWLHWVCALREDSDVPVLTQLSTDFPALAEFAAEMEESFWEPAERSHQLPAPASETPVATAKPAAPPTPEALEPILAKAEAAPVSQPAAPTASATPPRVRIKAGQLPPHIRTEFDKALHTGDYSGALSLCYDKPAIDASPAGNGSPAEVTASQPAAASVAAEPAPPLRFCTECGRTYPSRYNVCPFDSSALRDLPDSVPEPVAKADASLLDEFPSEGVENPRESAVAAALRDARAASSPDTAPQPRAAMAMDMDESATQPEPLLAGESSPSFGELTLSKRPVATWVAAAVLVALVAAFVWMHYFQGLNSRAGSSVANAATSDPAPANEPSPAAKALLHRQASEGAQDSILLSVENCERTNPAAIECWGYISSQRDKDSKVSLDRVDVVDGKGNSFDLSSKGQTTFADVHDFTVPAQSKVKYSIKVPDNDKEARTLTLYLDVNHPHGSEYTFRDIPISD